MGRERAHFADHGLAIPNADEHVASIVCEDRMLTLKGGWAADFERIGRVHRVQRNAWVKHTDAPVGGLDFWRVLVGIEVGYVELFQIGFLFPADRGCVAKTNTFTFPSGHRLAIPIQHFKSAFQYPDKLVTWIGTKGLLHRGRVRYTNVQANVWVAEVDMQILSWQRGLKVRRAAFHLRHPCVGGAVFI